MAMESTPTNGQRTGQPTPGDGGQAAQGAPSPAHERGQSLAPRERSGTLVSRDQWERSPFASLWQISREMDRLMDSFFGGGLASAAEPPFATAAAWIPQIEVRQRDDALLIHVDLPGIKQEDVEIEATEDGLSIAGERQAQREEGEHESRRTERTYGSFYRLIPLPEGARVEEAKATMHNGVLEVRVPLEPSKHRRIPIEGGTSRA